MAITSIKTGSSFTNLQKYNDFLGPNAAYIPTSFESIASANGTGSSGTITFSSIPSTYKHLQIRFNIFSSAENNAMNLRINGDTDTNYSFHQMYGDGTSTGSVGSANRDSIRIADYGVVSQFGNPTVGIIDIHDYASTTKNKVVRVFTGTDKNNAYAQGVELDSGLWRSTSAITSVTITVSSSNFTTSSRVSLYGIKG